MSKSIDFSGASMVQSMVVGLVSAVLAVLVCGVLDATRLVVPAIFIAYFGSRLFYLALIAYIEQRNAEKNATSC